MLKEKFKSTKSTYDNDFSAAVGINFTTPQQISIPLLLVSGSHPVRANGVCIEPGATGHKVHFIHIMGSGAGPAGREYKLSMLYMTNNAFGLLRHQSYLGGEIGGWRGFFMGALEHTAE